MPKPFSEDLRQRILDDFLSGMTFAQVGRKYTVSAEFVRQFIRRYQKTGEVKPRPPTRRVTPFYRKHETDIRAAVEDHAGLTLEQLRTKLGLKVSLATLWQAMKKLKLSFKKKLPTPPSSKGPTSPDRGPNGNSFAPPASTHTASFSSTKPGSKPI